LSKIKEKNLRRRFFFVDSERVVIQRLCENVSHLKSEMGDQNSGNRNKNKIMRSKAVMAKVLEAAVAVAVLASSASAAVISSDTTWANRTGILGQTDGFVEITSGATLTTTARVDHDGGVGDAGRVILNGGNLMSTVDYKFPDNNTGDPAFIGIYDGTFTANQFESFGLARGATIEIGANGIFAVESQYSAVTENDGNRYNVGNMILEGSLYASEGLTLDVQDLGGGAVQVTAIPEPATLSLLGLSVLPLLRRRK
jgi:hypothetical protein